MLHREPGHKGWRDGDGYAEILVSSPFYDYCNEVDCGNLQDDDDVDGDGKISLYEYYYFVIFMQGTLMIFFNFSIKSYNKLATKEKFLEFFGIDEEIS